MSPPEVRGLLGAINPVHDVFLTNKLDDNGNSDTINKGTVK